MRALTLWQPWASSVASGVKLIENRSWEPPPWLLGKQFIIHAGKKWDVDSYNALCSELGEDAVPTREETTFGALIAIATLEAVVTNAEDAERIGGFDQGRWFFGKFGWVLRDMHQLEMPIPCRGFQGLWTVDKELIHHLSWETN